jgi:aspartyl-tRNA(Asn)/glutamyl-tRNA(Gln) amidotransferase subunit A
VTEILTIAEAATLIAQRKLSPVELTRSHLERIERLDGELHAFILLTAERALSDAKAAEAAIMAGGLKGPLHGIPIAHKDIYSTRGIRTTGHSRVLLDHVPQEDAVTVARLAEAGTVMLGKLATHEFAWGGPSFDVPWPPPRNPWNLERFTGGSSSGTGAAVAAGLILGGTGSDTGGSIRFPAAFCGIAGLKPTYGLCPRTGVLPLSYSLDHAGPLAWTVEDCAILLDAMAGFDASDPACADVPKKDYRAALEGRISGLRIGFVRNFHEKDMEVSPETSQALEQTAMVFRGLDAEVRDVTLPPLQDWTACGMIIMMAEGYALHEPWLKTRMQDYGELFRDRVLLGAFLRGSDYVEAQRFRRELCAAFDAVMQDCDLLLCAVSPGPAPRFEELTKMSSFERPSLAFQFNVTGAPALTLRGGFSAEGLPVGIQIAGRPFEDDLVLRAGHAYERATNWSQRRPPERTGAGVAQATR